MGPDCVEPCEPWKQQTNLLWVGSVESREVIGGFEAEAFHNSSDVTPPLRILLVQVVSSSSESDFTLES